MDRYADGDDSAFADLYDALELHLLGFAMNLARHRPLAEDLVQQTFLQLHRSRARWVRGARVFPYTFSIAHHHFVDSTRREKYEQLASTETPEEVELPSEAPQADDALDGKRRLVALEELSVAEAAEVLQTEGRCPDEGRRASELTPAAGSAQRRAVRRRASGHRAA